MSNAQSQPDPVRSVPEQPAVEPGQAERNRRATLIGLVLAVGSVIAALVAPLFSAAGYSFSWPWLAIAATVAMTAIVGLQFRLWGRVRRGGDGVWSWRTASWAAHLLSYLVALLGLFALLVSMNTDGPVWFGFWLWLLAALGLLAAQASGAVQYLREAGPPGTLPAHLRRLLDGSARLGR